MRRPFSRGALAATLGLCAGLLLSAQTPQQPSVFRISTNLVTVDAYPRRDGRIVEGLTPANFEVLEDGVVQKIDQFEFVRIEPTPEVERRDPNNQREMLQLAADPHNRVFVTWLDIHHVTVKGSHDIRAPLVDFLNRVIAPNDLFGVVTSKLRPSSLVLGRRLLTVEDQLTRYWPWGERQQMTRDPDDPATSRDPDDPTEALIDRCFNVDPIHNTVRQAFDGEVQRPLTDILIDRRREESALINLRDLVAQIGTLRDARSLLVAITDGWRLFKPDSKLVERALNEQAAWAPPSPPPITVTGGRVGVNSGLNANYSQASCNAELARLGNIDDQALLRQIMTLANRGNVVFYPVNPDGLELFDTTLARTPLPVTVDMGWHTARVDSALTLAENTDGIAVVNTNDLRGGMAKIVNDVSAYYLLGYYSTNSKADGKYRQIKVRVKEPQNVAVVARRGYVATSAASAASAARSGAPAAAMASPATTNVAEGLGMLARLDTAGGLLTHSAVFGTDLVVVAEITSGQVAGGKWASGASVKVTVAGPSGENAGAVTGQIDAGARAALVQVPIGAVAGPWRVGVTVTGADGTLDDRFDVTPAAGKLLADPIIYRGATGARAALRPVAEFLFHRTERVHAEFPVLKAIDQRTARVLDRRGQPLPLEATLTERDDAGKTTLVADLNLAPLSPADYVLEVTVVSGSETQRRQVGIRVVR